MVTNTISISISPPIKPLPSPEMEIKSRSKAGSFNEILIGEQNKIKNKAMKQEHSLGVPNGKLRAEMHNLRKRDPNLQKLYNSAMERAKLNEAEEDGTKNALKELAKQFGNQFTSILWQQMFKKDTGSLAEKLWSSELTTSLVNQDEELNDFEENIYNELLEEWKANNIIGGK